MRNICLNLDVGYNKYFLVEYCSRDVPDHLIQVMTPCHPSAFFVICIFPKWPLNANECD